jgi:hypothetical protein
MIRDLKNGVRVVELGLGTSFVSIVHSDGDEEAGMICFSNTPIVDGKLQGDEVLIHVANANGVFSYFQAIVDMLSTWKLDGTDEQVIVVKNQLEVLQGTLREKRAETATK